MDTTKGFELLLELSRGLLQQIIDAGRKQAAPALPKTLSLLDEPVDVGPVQVIDAILNVEELTVELEFLPAINHIRLSVPGAQAQLILGSPPTPNTVLLDVTADVTLDVPLEALQFEAGEDGKTAVGFDLSQLTRDKISVSLTSGHPLDNPDFTRAFLESLLHAAYRDATIPTELTLPLPLLGVNTVVFVQVLNDLGGDPHRQISVTSFDGEQVSVRLPVEFHWSTTVPEQDRAGLMFPIGAAAPITFSGTLVKQLDEAPATVNVEGVEAEVGEIEPGQNYNQNLGVDNFEEAVRSTFDLVAGSAVDELSKLFPVQGIPAANELGDFIADRAHQFLRQQPNPQVQFWAPGAIADVLHDVTAKVVTSEVVAIAINAGDEADADAIEDFIPQERQFAVAFGADALIEHVESRKNLPQDQGGLGLPLIHDLPGLWKLRINDVHPSFGDGFLRIDGDVTILRAVLSDINGEFSDARVGLSWVDNDDGTQSLDVKQVREPDVNFDFSLAALILGALAAIFTGGLFIGLLVAAVVFVVERIVERIGGAALTGEVNALELGPLPGNLQGVIDLTSRFTNPITISPDAIIFAGEASAASVFEDTEDAHARAGGPYLGTAAESLAFNGGKLAPQTTYQWSFGDGEEGLGANASHTYVASGHYAARLISVDAQRGPDAELRTVHYALVHAENQVPQVQLGPSITVDEGDEVEFIATFSDVEWVDTHRATFFFGDNSQPVAAEINETNEPPQARGTARTTHRYCDNGVFETLVRVIDTDGGVAEDTQEVIVRNVAPTVEAGDDWYAYPCIPLRLVAHFTDPGWCDSHEAWWDFGDCAPPQPRAAVVYETHNAPLGRGIAVATHVYRRCGNYVAEATVTDDDGGSGADTLVVKVVELKNGDFEGGFQVRRTGTVANHWEPYVRPALSAVPEPIFHCEACVVHDGYRAQRITAGPYQRAGLWQQIGANPGWEYEVLACCHIEEGRAGTCRLGIDPMGGTDPDAPSIVWAEHQHAGEWRTLSCRATADGLKRAVTVFLEGAPTHGGVFFDSVRLTPFPCAFDPAAGLKPDPVCVSWTDERAARSLGLVHRKDGFTFRSRSSEPLAVVSYGLPTGEHKLQVPYVGNAPGMTVELPFPAQTATAKVSGGGMTMIALNQSGIELAVAQHTGSNEVVELAVEVADKDIRVLRFDSVERPLLHELCIERGRRPRRPPESDSTNCGYKERS